MLDTNAISTCTGKNPFSQATRDTMVGWTGANAKNGWRQPLGHPAKKGYKPLEVFNP